MTNQQAHRFRHGLYKFGSSNHTASLIDAGNVFLSNISNFRDSGLHSGLIYDGREGQVSLIDGNDRHDISVDDAFIYCTTQELISESLEWAISEKKECAALIVDPQIFLGSLQANLAGFAEFLVGGPCAYAGRDIDRQQLPLLYDQIFAEHNLAAMIKPTNYWAQMEHRAVFKYLGAPPCPPSKNCTIENLGRMIPVQYEGMEALFSAGWTGWVGASLIDKAGVPMSWFATWYPQQVLNTIFFEQGRVEYIGFVSRSNVMKGVQATSRYLPFAMIENTTIMAAAPVNEVGVIKYHLGDDPPPNLRKRS